MSNSSNDVKLWSHGGSIEEIHNIPMNVLIRPFPLEVEEPKIKSLMDTLKDNALKEDVPPINVLWLTGSEGGNYYFFFGDGNSYEASKRLGLQTIRAKLVRSTLQDLSFHLGGMTPPDLK